MKSKETIRHQILHYGRLIWEARNIDKMDPLISLLTEAVANELFLIQNNINDIDQLLLNKLAALLTPDSYAFTRPAHAILQITPTRPTFEVDNNSEFYLKDLPQHLQNKGISLVTFCPVTPIRLTNVSITHMFYKNTLWGLNHIGEKNEIARASENSDYNQVWLGIEVHEKVRDLKDLYFYFDFPHLDENHDYYDLLPFTQWKINNKEIETFQGIPNSFDNKIQDFDRDVLHFYHDHYLSISHSIPVSSLSFEALPENLKKYISIESMSGTTPRLWIQITFPPNFSPMDLERMTVALNAFPVSNKRQCEQRFTKNNLQGISLPAENGELFLAIKSIEDNEKRPYYPVSSEREYINGSYYLEVVKSEEASQTTAFDDLERLLDIIGEERISLPGIDTDKMHEMMHSLKKSQEDVDKKFSYNRKSKPKEIAKIRINPHTNSNNVYVRYWSTGGSTMNGIMKGSVFMAQKNSPLDKDNTILLTASCGGKEFSENTDIMAINKYMLTSNDHIITKANIEDFCKSELGLLLKSVQVSKMARISPKPKEGIINMISVNLTPSEEYVGLTKKKGVLRDLKIRLQQRSPDHYHYMITMNDDPTHSNVNSNS